MFYGKNQIREIIHASKVSVFFIDETQQIDIKDFGTIENIKKAADDENAIIIENSKYELKSQFRCNGSDEYINWVEGILYSRYVDDAVEYTDYELRLFDDLLEMQKEIKKRDSESTYPSRMLSGDVFPWISMKDKTQIDINIGDFHAQWNKKNARNER